MKRKLILASQSPRRSDLMRSLGIPFEVDPAVGFQEVEPSSHAASELVLINAEGKAKEVATRRPQDLILGVDTIGLYQGQILEKPKDEEDAFRMLKMLQGQKHEVLSGLCLLDSASSQKRTHVESTWVTFSSLSDEEIRAYIKTGEPMDKAASYAAQGLGALFIQKIEGDYFNVVGLPLYRLNLMLKEFDIHLFTD